MEIEFFIQNTKMQALVPALGGGGGEAKKKEIKEKEENKLKVYFENVVLLSKSIGPSKSLVGMCGI